MLKDVGPRALDSDFNELKQTAAAELQLPFQSNLLVSGPTQQLRRRFALVGITMEYYTTVHHFHTGKLIKRFNNIHFDSRNDCIRTSKSEGVH